jgi:DNA-binding transcriptional regulator YiaG
MAASKRAMAEKVGADFIADMEKMIATAKAGGLKAVKAKYGTKTTPPEPLELPVLTQRDVVAVRNLLGVSQAVFAKILGVSAQSVRSLELGTKPPTGAVRRLLGEIRDQPDYWRTRFGLGSRALG